MGTRLYVYYTYYHYVHKFFLFFLESLQVAHVSALLHALVAATFTEFTIRPSSSASTSEEELPVTSYPCQWKAPKKRKQSTIRFADSIFEKHVYGKVKKRRLEPLEDFDPRPDKFKGTAKNALPALLNDLRGEELCISLLLDSNLCPNDGATLSSSSAPTSTNLPSIEKLKKSVSAFKESLCLSDEKIREIELNTREQRESALWFQARRYRITSSLFGQVLRRKEQTPPGSLVLQILQPKQFSTPATQWGVSSESHAREQYIQHQLTCGRDGLIVAPAGFFISKSQPFLGASPDGAVYDPSSANEPFGFLEIKCPFKHKNSTPQEACRDPTFCCTYDSTAQQVVLKRTHVYFAQVQGQMAIGNRPWCDFVIYTTKGVSIHRVRFDEDYWKVNLLPKLTSFYDNCVAPEIVSPVHVLGIPIRNLLNE